MGVEVMMSHWGNAERGQVKSWQRSTWMSGSSGGQPSPGQEEIVWKMVTDVWRICQKRCWMWKIGQKDNRCVENLPKKKICKIGQSDKKVFIFCKLTIALDVGICIRGHLHRQLRKLIWIYCPSHRYSFSFVIKHFTLFPLFLKKAMHACVDRDHDKLGKN